MGGLVIKDENWPAARLIPIASGTGVEAQERRVTSALLAVISAVPEFGRALLRPLGAPAGRIETFIEIPFRMEGRSVRPDGVIAVTRGGKSWGALVEAKTAGNPLSSDQMNMYLDLARDLGLEAVLSISNQYVTSSTAYPIEVDRRKARKVRLHHWSWIDVLTEAIVQEKYRGVSDPDQAYILGELIRYLSDPRSGALSFEGMGQYWTAVREGTRDRTLRKADFAAQGVAARWDDLLRYLALTLTKELGEDVRPALAATEKTPQARLTALVDSLVSKGRLYGELRIPNAAGHLRVEADLRARLVVVSTRIDAPREGRAKTRVSWVLRQLQNAPDLVKIEARMPRGASLAATLRAAREDPELLLPDSSRELRQFVISLSRNMGLKRDAGRGSFVSSVLNTTEEFYREVLQNLRVWKAAPPKLKRPAEAAEEVAHTVAEKLDVSERAIDEVAIEEDAPVSSTPFADVPPGSGPSGNEGGPIGTATVEE
jgi:hypothetical protein